MEFVLYRFWLVVYCYACLDGLLACCNWFGFSLLVLGILVVDFTNSVGSLHFAAIYVEVGFGGWCLVFMGCGYFCWLLCSIVWFGWIRYLVAY